MGQSSLRTQQRDNTRRLLVDAAIELFARNGYVRTTVDEISEAVGASRATFYLHFKNKRELIVVKAQEFLPSFSDRYRVIDGKLSRPADLFLDDLRAWFLEWHEWAVQNRDLLAAYAEASKVEPELDIELGDPALLINDMPNFLNSVPEESRHEALKRAELLLAMTTAAMNWLIFRETPAEVDLVLDYLVTLWYRLLKWAPLR
jgi:AcrR family transcriptional regulator